MLYMEIYYLKSLSEENQIKDNIIFELPTFINKCANFEYIILIYSMVKWKDKVFFGEQLDFVIVWLIFLSKSNFFLLSLFDIPHY